MPFGASNYPPGVTGREPQISGYGDDPVALYLVCTSCGEAFDALETAREHEMKVRVGDQEDASLEDIAVYYDHMEPKASEDWDFSFYIQDESEAM
jgi:hypothetical protein